MPSALYVCLQDDDKIAAFAIDPEGRHLFAAGSATGRLASYRIDRANGALSPLATYEVGRRPMAVLAAVLAG